MTTSLEISKNRVRQELDNVFKLAVNHSTAGPLSSDVEQLICNAIEAVFIHGLLDAFFIKNSQYYKYPEPNIWPFILKFTHGSVEKQVLALNQIKTEIGKSRAWIRIVLNEGALEHYIQMIVKNDNQLSQFYVKSAFLRDGEKIEILNGYLKVLSRIPINLPSNSTVLNNWNPKPLILAGLVPEKNLPSKSSTASSTNTTVQSTTLMPAVDPRFSRLTLEGRLARTRKLVKSLDDAETSSIYSHSSIPEQNDPMRHSFQNKLVGTPENEEMFIFQSTSQQNSDVVVRHVRGRIRSLSKSSNSSSTTTSQNISLSAITQGAETEVERSIIKSSKEEISKQALFDAVESQHESDKPSGSSQKAVDEPDATTATQSDIVPIRPKVVNFDPVVSSFDNSSFSQRLSTSLQEEFAQSGYHNDSSISGINSVQGNILSSPECKASSDQCSSFSPDLFSSSVLSFDTEMRFVLENQQDKTIETDKGTNRSASSTETNSLSGACSKLTLDEEFVESKLIIEPKSDVEVIDDNEGLKETNEYGIEIEAYRMLTEIQNEQGLVSQEFRCLSCLKSIGGSSFSPHKVCALDGKYYCEECMRRSSESVIPARLIYNWDCRPRQISRPSKELLKAYYDQPIFNIDKLNPLLYENAPQIEHIHKLRVKLSHTAMYLLSCKNSIADDLKRRFYPHEYLCFNVHLYSIKDLENVLNGVLERRLSAIIDFAVEHILSCVLCIQKGFICELCNSRHVIYPFQIESTSRCQQCLSIYHRHCFEANDQNCPKCKRKAQRTSLAKEVKFMYK